jgi:hypothetical protein
MIHWRRLGLAIPPHGTSANPDQATVRISGFNDKETGPKAALVIVPKAYLG